ncbi:MAG TPA: nuclear transport factor 2 family protein [Pyrinomonadaceae bacterium]|nr:nuclear transport factor 2 family protein [Pyrinomonadaceae bacterium]
MPENPPVGRIEKEVESRDEEFNQAAVAGDIDKLSSIMDEGYIFVSGIGQKMSKGEHLNSLKSGNIKYKKLTASEVKVRAYGDAAVVTARVAGEGSNSGQSISGSHLVTRVYVKQGGQWKIVSAHSTRSAQ